LALFVRLPNQNIVLSSDVCHFPVELEWASSPTQPTARRRPRPPCVACE
jgi:hypothetical protein